MPQPLHVLIVEDDPADAELVLRELRRAGFEPDWHRVQTEAEYVDRLRPDVDIILSDCRLPGFGGQRALELLNEHGLSIPFIIISGTIGEDVAVEVMKLGAGDYLLKDRLGRLGLAVNQALDQGRLHRERCQTEDELRRTHEQLQRLLEHSPAVIYSMQLEGDRVGPLLVSDNITRLLDYSVQEASHFDWWAIQLHPEDRQRAFASLRETVERGGLTCEYRIRHKNGSYVCLEDNRRVVSDVEGRPMEIAGVWTDVTERRRLQAEVELRDQRLNAFFSSAAAGLTLLDKDMRFVRINNTLAEINGLLPEEHIGRTVQEVLPKFAPVVEPLLQKVLATGEPILNIELTGETPLQPGVPRHWIESLFPIAGIDGHPDGVGVVVVEITERKRVEESLRLSEERFRQLAENIQEVFWITDVAKERMLYISPAYEAIWGRTCESLHACAGAWLEAIHPDDRDRVFEAATTRQTRGTYDEEYRIVRPDGSLRWIRDRAFPVRNGGGEIYRVVGVAEDISERKQADDRLREQASLLDKARDAIMVRDFDHRITYWNKSAERLYGWEVEEVMGRKTIDLLQHDLRLFEKASEDVITLGEWTGEFVHTNKAGGQILIEARWTLVHDAEGRPKGILAINTDITERRKLEQQFLRAQRLESIGTLAGGIAHDLNNMLSPIMMSIDLLKLTCRDQRTQAILSTIETSARRGAEMVQQILSFARGVEGQRVTIAPQEIIRDIQHLVQDTFPKNILFRAEVPADLPAFLGDHTQVHQVLLNLCVNARDAMPGSGMLSIIARSITVDDNYAAMTPDAKPGEYVMIKVTDTGTGIPREVVDKIFDPFFTTKDQGKGTGLGLSTVLAIVKSHGGFVSVQSEPDQGTTFTVCLPSKSSSADLTSAAQEEMHPRGKGELILIVDDEAAVRTITQQTLEAFGYRVLVAADGAAAVAIYAQYLHLIAAVLTDMMMPVMDGPATIQVLIRLNPAVKIIAASGLNADGGVAKAAGMGVKYFLPKPYTAQTILTTLNKVLNDGT